MKYAGIPYEAFGEKGQYVRDAQVIHELPTPDNRLAACIEATDTIGKMLGLSPVHSIHFGAPVYIAFGMTLPEVKSHPKMELLLKHGGDVPLTYCN